MSKKYGLGKGLGALIPEEENIVENSAIKIPLNMIKPNSEQPRKNFNDETIANLAESVKEHGIIQPLILKKQDDMYIIVAGERRWRAAKKVGLNEVPAIVMDLSDKDVLEISLIENIQREDLNPIEEAIAYKKLLVDFEITQEDLAIKIGKSRSAITNCMRLLNLDKRVQDYIIDGVLSEGHGRALLAVDDNNLQYILAQKVIDDTLNVRQTEFLVRASSKKPAVQKNEVNDKLLPYYNDVKDKLQNYFGTKVLVSNKNNKGKIEIEYYSNEDLERILDILKL